MCGAQLLQYKSESAPQIIGAHQPHQACNEYTHVHVLKAQSQQEVEGAHLLGQLSHIVITLQHRDWGSLISESGRGRGAQLLAS